MNVGIQIFKPTKGTLGVIKNSQGEEIYTEESSDYPFLFEVKFIGPHKKYQRAVNFLTYNRALEKFAKISQESFSGKKRILQALRVLKKKEKLSPLAKRGLNIYNKRRLT